MSSSTTLEELLLRYVSADDQDAFAEIVRSGGGLVWGVAMRRLGDPQLAEEAAQNVFLALARKAPTLAQRPGLLSWLHRAAILEASALARARLRRSQRLDTMIRESMPPTPAPEPVSPAGPWLDEAINKLSQDERALILGRFYHQRTLRELAVEVGKSEEAVKKQAQRALDKLEVLLRRRGMGVVGAALGSLLTSELSAAPPPAFGPSLTASVLSSLGTPAATPSLATCLLAIMSTTKMTIAATGILLVLLATSLHQVEVNAALRQEVGRRATAAQGSRHQPQPSTPPPGASRNSSVPSPSSNAFPFPLDADSLIRAMARSTPNASGLYDPGPGMDEAQRVIESMTPEEKWTLWDSLAATNASPALLRLAREWVLLHLVEDDPRRVLDLIVDHRFSGHTQACMQTWARLDPDTAWSWLTEADAEGRLLRTRAEGEAPEDVLRRGFAEGLALRKIDDAIEFTRRHLSDEGAEWLVAGTGAILLKQGDQQELLDLAAGLPTDEARARALVDAARAPVQHFDVMWAVRHVAPLLDQPALPHHLRQTVLRETAATSHDESIWPSLLLVHQASPPDLQAENLAWLVDRFSRERPSQLASTVTLADPGEQNALDRALADTATALAQRGQGRQAREFAGKIRDENLRTQSLARLAP